MPATVPTPASRATARAIDLELEALPSRSRPATTDDLRFAAAAAEDFAEAAAGLALTLRFSHADQRGMVRFARRLYDAVHAAAHARRVTL